MNKDVEQYKSGTSSVQARWIISFSMGGRGVTTQKYVQMNELLLLV